MLGRNLMKCSLLLAFCLTCCHGLTGKGKKVAEELASFEIDYTGNLKEEHNGSHDTIIRSAHDTIVRSAQMETKAGGEDHNAHQSFSAKASDNHTVAAAIINAVLTVIQCAIGLVFAVLYKSKVVDKIDYLEAKVPNTQGKDFPSGLFDCASDKHMFLHVCFCLPCRVAHTWHVAELLRYWPSVAVMVVCPHCLPCIGAFWGRAKLREKLGMEADRMSDFLKLLCCCMCVFAQDAYKVDEETGVEVQCFCKIAQTSSRAVLTRDHTMAENMTRNAWNTEGTLRI